MLNDTARHKRNICIISDMPETNTADELKLSSFVKASVLSSHWQRDNSCKRFGEKLPSKPIGLYILVTSVGRLGSEESFNGNTSRAIAANIMRRGRLEKQRSTYQPRLVVGCCKTGVWSSTSVSNHEATSAGLDIRNERSK